MSMRLLAGALGTAVFLGAGVAHAGSPTVNFDDAANPEKATSIDNLVIGSNTYNVEFTADVFAEAVYGAYPGTFDFPSSDLTGADAAAATEAVNIAISAADAEFVGAVGEVGAPFYRVGFLSFILPIGEIESVAFWEATYESKSDPWVTAPDPDIDCYSIPKCSRVWAVFTKTSGEPEGACCIGGDCDILTAAACSDADGEYQGDGTRCVAGTCDEPKGCVGDLNGDGSVGFADLQELLQNWGCKE